MFDLIRGLHRVGPEWPKSRLKKRRSPIALTRFNIIGSTRFLAIPIGHNLAIPSTMNGINEGKKEGGEKRKHRLISFRSTGGSTSYQSFSGSLNRSLVVVRTASTGFRTQNSPESRRVIPFFATPAHHSLSIHCGAV